MAFADSFLDQIRARVPGSEVVAKRVRLKRSGRGELTGLCPFHDEKTPSFTVNDAKGFYHCFGCGAHGSAFDFLMQTDGLSFPEAVERLAGMAGLEMPARSRDPQDKERREGRERLYGLLEVAAAWFEDRLRHHGDVARRYLEDRSIDGAAAAQFRLGFAPDSRDALKQALLARGYTVAELVRVGLLVAPEDGGEAFDRFRNRVMFPITDRRGQIVAFGGRTLGEARAKYLNSPETEFFHKGSLLYNLAGARSASREAGTVLVAEGYTDVISLWRHGFRHAVAPLGTALTDNQLGELWRLAPEPVLCLDGDAAGMRAAVRAAENALPLLKPGHSLRFALLPAGEDPDSLLRGGGAKAFG
ncbi:MAG: DNA primase, partial [Proteobacteria bacterium]|nr:DNA primase [Pseudomonadota bacterium]